MEKDFLIVDNNKNDITELKQSDGKILVKQFSGLNTDNFIIKKYNGKRLDFSFFKLNGIYYINLNGCHIIDYKHFINIQHVSKVNEDVSIKNPYIGEIMLLNCDVDIVHKALLVMADWMRSKQNFIKDMMYYVFH